MGWVSISSDCSFGAVEKQLGKEFSEKLFHSLWPTTAYDPKASMRGFTVLGDAKRAGFKPDGFSVGKEHDDKLTHDTESRVRSYTDGGAW